MIKNQILKIMDKVSDNPLKNRIDSQSALMVVTALFVTLYLVSNIMAVKVVGFFSSISMQVQ